MKIYLVRHSITRWNELHKVQGVADIELNQEGRELAIKTNKQLTDFKYDLIYSSPLKRAQESAKLIFNDSNIIIDNRIKEIDFGVCEGDNQLEARNDSTHRLHNFFMDPSNYVPKENAESYETLRKRSQDFFNNELKPLENKYDSIVVVSHGAFIRESIMWIEGLDRDLFWKGKPLKNCCFNEIELKDGQFKLIEEGKVYY